MQPLVAPVVTNIMSDWLEIFKIFQIGMIIFGIFCCTLSLLLPSFWLRPYLGTGAEVGSVLRQNTWCAYHQQFCQTYVDKIHFVKSMNTLAATYIWLITYSPWSPTVEEYLSTIYFHKRTKSLTMLDRIHLLSFACICVCTCICFRIYIIIILDTIIDDVTRQT